MSGSAYALSRRAALLLRSRTTTTSGKEGVEEFSGGGGTGKGREIEDGSSSSSSSSILAGPLGGLRPMACEDCAVGLWLLAHDVRHGEDLRMCRYDSEIEVEEEKEVEVGEATAAAATATKRKRHSCAPANAAEALMAPVVVTNRCNGLCDPVKSLEELHSDPACRAPTLGGGGADPFSAGAPLSSAAAVLPALPLGDFWSSGHVLSYADAVALECIRVTADGNVDKSACKEKRT